ncbi:hypothetical protein RBB50_004120 [Rhinocladiella similis]
MAGGAIRGASRGSSDRRKRWNLRPAVAARPAGWPCPAHANPSRELPTEGASKAPKGGDAVMAYSQKGTSEAVSTPVTPENRDDDGDLKNRIASYAVANLGISG